MKTIIQISLTIALGVIQCYSQGMQSMVWITHQNLADSVLIGVDNNSTIGIDTSFGEKDIKNIPFDDFEIRVIQRDSVSYNCLIHPWNYEPIYSPNNVDSKIDFRPEPYGEDGSFNTINNNFEIIFKSDSVPYDIYGDFQQFGGFHWGNWGLLDSNCNLVTDGNFYYRLLHYTISDNQQYTLLVHLEFDIGVDEHNRCDNLNIFPTPAVDKIQISDLGVKNGKIEIIDIMGNIVYSVDFKAEENVIILTKDFVLGLYFVRIFDKDKKAYSVKKFVKM